MSLPSARVNNILNCSYIRSGLSSGTLRIQYFQHLNTPSMYTQLSLNDSSSQAPSKVSSDRIVIRENVAAFLKEPRALVVEVRGFKIDQTAVAVAKNHALTY